MPAYRLSADGWQVSRTFFTLPVSTRIGASAGGVPAVRGLNLRAKAASGHDHAEDSHRTDFRQVPKWASKQSVGPLGLSIRTRYTGGSSLIGFNRG
jgi:hypothetical protein